MNSLPVVKTTGLTYHYAKGPETLSNINITINKGNIYGFLGPNGSGKTTTLSLLLGLLDVQEGSIEIFGKKLAGNRHSILKKIGSLIETPSLYGHLTASENLEVYRRLYGAPTSRVPEVLTVVGLEAVGTKKVKSYSLGMKQRLAIALALLPKPELLILDEPSNGLDPTGFIELRTLVKKLNKEEGMTIIISSHILAEVEKMVSHVGVIAKGRMLFQGSLYELQRLQQNEGRLHIHTSDNNTALDLLYHYKPQRAGDLLSVCFDDPGQIAAINRLLTYNNLDVYRLQPMEQNLEQLFIDLTKN